MGEYHNGRTTAIHAVGSKVETRLVEYEKEIVRFKHRIEAFDAAGEKIKETIVHLRRDIAAGKVPIKMGAEAEKWLKKAAGDIYSLLSEATESKQKSEGAHTALQDTVLSLKKMFDEEERKKAEIEEWESRENKTLDDFKERPVGAEIEPHALVEARERRTYAIESEQAREETDISQLELNYDVVNDDTSTPEKPKRQRRKPKVEVQENPEPRPRKARRRKKKPDEQIQAAAPPAPLDT